MRPRISIRGSVCPPVLAAEMDGIELVVIRGEARGMVVTIGGDHRLLALFLTNDSI